MKTVLLRKSNNQNNNNDDDDSNSTANDDVEIPVETIGISGLNDDTMNIKYKFFI